MTAMTVTTVSLTLAAASSASAATVFGFQGPYAPINWTFTNRPLHNIISKLKVFLVKESTRIKIILIASYFFSKIELATIDTHYSYRTV